MPESGTQEPDSPSWPQQVEQAVQDLHRRVSELEEAPRPEGFTSLLRRLDEQQHRYATVIQVVGYGGFFALWSTTYKRMPLLLFGVAGALIGLSLLVYVAWELFLVWRSADRIAKARAATGLTEERLGQILDEGDEELHRWWRFAWVFSVATGVSGGLVVLGFYFWAGLSGRL